MIDAPPPAPRVGSLSLAEFRTRLEGVGLAVRIGPFDLRIGARVHGLAPTLYALYRDYPLLEAGNDAGGVRHAHLEVREVWHVGRRVGRRVRFLVDGRAPHEDMPVEHALAVLEWGINLVIAMRFHRYLMLHAAVLERDGYALLLPAWPGHGKTTLCAALAHRGWRLLSDEFGLVEPGSIALQPLPRPMPLKNESIAALRAFAPEAFLGPKIANTKKGTVAHVRAPTDAVERAAEIAPAAWVVFPRWRASAALELELLPKSEGFAQLATNAFNYELLGEAAFDTVERIVAASSCHRLEYSRLDDAVSALGTLCAR